MVHREAIKQGLSGVHRGLPIIDSQLIADRAAEITRNWCTSLANKEEIDNDDDDGVLVEGMHPIDNNNKRNRRSLATLNPNWQ